MFGIFGKIFIVLACLYVLSYIFDIIELIKKKKRYKFKLAQAQKLRMPGRPYGIVYEEKKVEKPNINFFQTLEFVLAGKSPDEIRAILAERCPAEEPRCKTKKFKLKDKKLGLMQARRANKDTK
jgi:hypothetical protein